MMKPEDVKIGCWYTQCCILDLEQVTTEKEVEYYRGLPEGHHLLCDMWPSREEAEKALTPTLSVEISADWTTVTIDSPSAQEDGGSGDPGNKEQDAAGGQPG